MKRILVFILLLMLAMSVFGRTGRLGNDYIYLKRGASTDTVYVGDVYHHFIVAMDSAYIAQLKAGTVTFDTLHVVKIIADSVEIIKWLYVYEIGISDSSLYFIGPNDTLKLSASKWEPYIFSWLRDNLQTAYIDSFGNAMFMTGLFGDSTGLDSTVTVIRLSAEKGGGHFQGGLIVDLETTLTGDVGIGGAPGDSTAEITGGLEVTGGGIVDKDLTIGDNIVGGNDEYINNELDGTWYFGNANLRSGGQFTLYSSSGDSLKLSANKNNLWVMNWTRGGGGIVRIDTIGQFVMTNQVANKITDTFNNAIDTTSFGIFYSAGQYYMAFHNSTGNYTEIYNNTINVANNASNSTLSVVNTDGTYKADLSVEGDITAGDSTITHGLRNENGLLNKGDALFYGDVSSRDSLIAEDGIRNEGDLLNKGTGTFRDKVGIGETVGDSVLNVTSIEVAQGLNIGMELTVGDSIMPDADAGAVIGSKAKAFRHVATDTIFAEHYGGQSDFTIGETGEKATVNADSIVTKTIRNEGGLLNKGDAEIRGNVDVQGKMVIDDSIRVKNYIKFADNISSTFLGLNTGRITTGTRNTFLGYQSGYSNTTGYSNVGIGNGALGDNIIGGQNIAIGYNALNDNTNSNNIGIGVSALNVNTTGDGNVSIGTESMVLNTTGDNNTAIGLDALSSNVDGSDNTVIGKFAGDNLTTGSDNIAIGSGVDLQSATGSNQINIGNKFKVASDGNITLDAVGAGATYADITNSGAGAAKLYVEGDQVNSDDLSDVASIAMLDENETISGNWVNTAYPWADDEVENDLTINSTKKITTTDSSTALLGLKLRTLDWYYARSNRWGTNASIYTPDSLFMDAEYLWSSGLNRIATNSSIYMPNDTVFAKAMGVGTTSLGASLHVNGAIRAERTGSIGFYVTGSGDRTNLSCNSNNDLLFNFPTSGAVFFIQNSSGNVGKGTTDPQHVDHIVSSDYPQRCVTHTVGVDSTLEGTDSNGDWNIIPSGGNVNFGTANLNLTGSIASTGSRVTKGWFTALEVTNEAGLTIGGTAISSIYQPLHASLTSIAGLTEADVSIIEATADNAYNVVTSGGNNYILGSNAGNTALEFKAPTGSGAPVLATSPTLVTPNIGIATGTSLDLSTSGPNNLRVASTDNEACIKIESNSTDYARIIQPQNSSNMILETGGFTRVTIDGTSGIVTLADGVATLKTYGQTVVSFGTESRLPNYGALSGDYITTSVQNTDFKLALPIPSEEHGETVILDSIFVIVDTGTDAAYITNVLLETNDWDGTGTTRVTYATDIGNGDQTTHTTNILASDYTMLAGNNYWILFDPAGETGAGEVFVYGTIVYYHTE